MSCAALVGFAKHVPAGEGMDEGRAFTPARHGSADTAVSIQMHPSAGSNSLVRPEFGVAEPKKFTTIETIQYLGLIRPLADLPLA